MLSVTRREVVAILSAGAVAAVVGVPVRGVAEEQKNSAKKTTAKRDPAKRDPEQAPEKVEKPLSAETILEKKFTGKATVEFLVGRVGTLNIDALFVPGVSHTQIVDAKLPGVKDGQEFCVVVSRETATRLLHLGIDDPAEHFRGKLLRVSGAVERVERELPVGTLYKIHVTSLDQLENIRKP